MKIDMAVLRSLEREKDISFDLVVQAIESALLTAYKHTEDHQPHARVALDRSTGEVAVLAAEVDEAGAVLREYDDTPEGFGRIAASTAKQVILQRLREAESASVLRRVRRARGRCRLRVRAASRPAARRSTQPQRHGQARRSRGRHRGRPAAR